MSALPKLDFERGFQERLVRLLHQDSGFAEAALAHLRPENFEVPVHAWVVKQMRQSLRLDGSLPDTLALKQERRKAERLGVIRKEDRVVYRRFLNRKINKPVPNRSYLKRELQTFVKHQEVKRLILESVDDYLPKGRYAEIDKRMLEVLDIDLTGDYSPGTDPSTSYARRIKKRLRAPENGITTGIDTLDRLMVAGGLTPKQLGVCIAPTGRGKSNYLINLAASAVLSGVRTLYVTLELDEDTILTRMDARFTGIPINELRDSPKQVRRAWRRLKPITRGNMRVKEFPPGSTTVAALKQYIRRLEREGFFPELIVIDYADLLQPRIEFSDSSYETQGQVYLDLLAMLAELKIVGWTATQGNRKSMDKDAGGDIDLSMMADSVKKAFLAFVVVGLAQSAKDKKFKRGRIAVLKNRNGATDRELKVVIDHPTCTFRSMAA